jgi:hypothetical protein
MLSIRDLKKTIANHFNITVDTIDYHGSNEFSLRLPKVKNRMYIHVNMEKPVDSLVKLSVDLVV